MGGGVLGRRLDGEGLKGMKGRGRAMGEGGGMGRGWGWVEWEEEDKGEDERMGFGGKGISGGARRRRGMVAEDWGLGTVESIGKGLVLGPRVVEREVKTCDG